MKIIIKNPAPTDLRQKKWGDYHFGRCLVKYFNRLGAEVKTHYKSDWQKKDSADAIIVIRGKFPYQPKSRHIYILWIISHPGTITAEECEAYDAVCVASYTHAESLKQEISVPVFPLLQCTDHEEFSDSSIKYREEIVFVGNTRGVPRDCVIWAIEYGLPLKIWGRGWEQLIDPEHIVADYINNEDLGKLYAHAKFTFNDHWNDMRSLGYINNRILDVISCGLPVISDFHEELHRLFPDEILYYSSKENFFSCVEQMLIAYPEYQNKLSALAPLVKKEFSFESRAKFIFDLIRNLQGNKSKQRILRSGRKQGKYTNKKDDLNALNLLKSLRKRFNKDRDTRVCPLCGARFKNFLSFGTRARPDAQCPCCKSLGLHRLLWLYFLTRLYPRMGSGTKHILHVAPEPRTAEIMQNMPDLDYVSADLESSLAMVKMGLSDIQFPDARFNVVLCSNALEHIPDDKDSIHEMYRVLKPGSGYAVLLIPPLKSCPSVDKAVQSLEERENHAAKENDPWEKASHLMHRLSDVGFEVGTVSLYDDLGADLASFLGIKDQIIIESHKKDFSCQMKFSRRLSLSGRLKLFFRG